MRLVALTLVPNPDWIRLRKALWPDGSDAGHEAEMARFAADPDRYGQFMACADDGTPIGLAEVSLRSDYVNGTQTSPVAFLEGLYVVPASRRQGVARALLLGVGAWARARGCTELASDTPLENILSQSVHSRLGFSETERVVYFNMVLGPRRASQSMFTIHRANASDVVAMHSIQMRAFEEEGRRCGTRDIPPLQETAESIAEHVKTQVALVAREGDVVVGCVRGIRDGKTCTIRALVVEPAKHGQGIGSALLRALEAELSDVERIDLTTNTIMEGNVPFYERHGYRVYERTEPIPGIRLAHLTKSAGRGA